MSYSFSHILLGKKDNGECNVSLKEYRPQRVISHSTDIGSWPRILQPFQKYKNKKYNFVKMKSFCGKRYLLCFSHHPQWQVSLSELEIDSHEIISWSSNHLLSPLANFFIILSITYDVSYADILLRVFHFSHHTPICWICTTTIM